MNDIAPDAGSTVLHQRGCCFCGSEGRGLRRASLPAGDAYDAYKSCEPCFDSVCGGSYPRLDAEVERRARARSAALFKIGDPVEFDCGGERMVGEITGSSAPGGPVWGIRDQNDCFVLRPTEELLPWQPRMGERCSLITHAGSRESGEFDGYGMGNETRLRVPTDRSVSGFLYGTRESLRPDLSGPADAAAREDATKLEGRCDAACAEPAAPVDRSICVCGQTIIASLAGLSQGAALHGKCSDCARDFNRGGGIEQPKRVPLAARVAPAALRAVSQPGIRDRMGRLWTWDGRRLRG